MSLRSLAGHGDDTAILFSKQPGTLYTQHMPHKSEKVPSLSVTSSFTSGLTWGPE